MLRICRADGGGWDTGTCSIDDPCLDGFCGGATNNGVPGTCIAGTQECLAGDPRALRVCHNGDRWEVALCPGQQFCDTGVCRDLTNCVDNDNDGFGSGTDCLGPDCNDSNNGISPDGREVCGNGTDEDCDGLDAPCDCDPVAQDCPGTNLKCAPNSSFEFECRPNGMLSDGELCGGIPSSCERGLICLNDGAGGPNVCTRICSIAAGLGCGPGICNASMTMDGRTINLCSNIDACDPVDSPTCVAGSHCSPISDQGGACFGGGGSLGAGSACDPNNSLCGTGLTCITMDTSPACREWCKVARGNLDCPATQACAQITYTITLGEEVRQISAYGVCNP
jgi:hypothetical protein